MKALGCIFGGGVIAVILLVLVLIGSYNGLVTKDQEANQRWSQVENVYQRRFDLIPNLVETVKGVAGFEKSTFVEVAQARASVGQLKIDASKAPATAAELEKFQQAQGQLGAAMSRLMVVSENYPALKANENFRDLQAQLEGTENRISVERRNFNLAAQDFNTTVKRLPCALYAGLMGFNPKPYFTAEQGADKAPKVNFSFDPNK